MTKLSSDTKKARRKDWLKVFGILLLLSLLLFMYLSRPFIFSFFQCQKPSSITIERATIEQVDDCTAVKLEGHMLTDFIDCYRGYVHNVDATTLEIGFVNTYYRPFSPTGSSWFDVELTIPGKIDHIVISNGRSKRSIKYLTIIKGEEYP